MPGEAGADTVGPVIATESVPYVELLEKGVGWATIVAAAGASAGPVPPSLGTAKNEAKAVPAAGKVGPRPGQRSAVATEAETRATNLPEGVERSSILMHGPCVRKSRESAEVKGSPPKAVLSVRGTSPPKPTPGIGEVWSCRRRHLLGDWVGAQSIPLQVCLLSMSLVLLTFG